MKTRMLGNSGEKISAVGLGCMGMSSFYGTADEAESIATLHRSLELGINLWDTADIYGNGLNEQILSRVLPENRNKIFIATKFGFRVRDGQTYVDSSPLWLKDAVEDSLRRLKIETIDLYYVHRISADVPIEETVGAMSKLIEEGKIRYIGLSECIPDDLKKANSVHPITAVQSEYSLISRDVEEQILPLTKELGIAFIPFAPLSRGLIANKIDDKSLATNDFRKNLPRYAGEYWENNRKLSAELDELAAAKNCTAAQLALAWVLSRGDNIIPIPGTKRRKYLEENVEAVNIELSQEDLSFIEDILGKYPNTGPRYREADYKFLKK